MFDGRDWLPLLAVNYVTRVLTACPRPAPRLAFRPIGDSCPAQLRRSCSSRALEARASWRRSASLSSVLQLVQLPRARPAGAATDRLSSNSGVSSSCSSISTAPAAAVGFLQRQRHRIQPLLVAPAAARRSSVRRPMPACNRSWVRTKCAWRAGSKSVSWPSRPLTGVPQLLAGQRADQHALGVGQLRRRWRR